MLERIVQTSNDEEALVIRGTRGGGGESQQLLQKQSILVKPSCMVFVRSRDTFNNGGFLCKSVFINELVEVHAMEKSFNVSILTHVVCISEF